MRGYNVRTKNYQPQLGTGQMPSAGKEQLARQLPEKELALLDHPFLLSSVEVIYSLLVALAFVVNHARYSVGR